jgi:hypothetical protein
MLLAFKKIISLIVVMVIAASSPMAFASKFCCEVPVQKENTETNKMKCHETAESSKAKKTENNQCNCNCEANKISFYNLPKIIKVAERYSQKYSNLNSQVIQKALSYGIFTPPKLS